MNTYHIFDPAEYATILFKAVAENKEQVIDLAKENDIDLTGLEIELIKTNVKDELGRQFPASIADALVH